MTVASKDLTPVDLSALLVNFKLNLLAGLNCVKIGKVQAFDAAKKTVVVQIMGLIVLPDNQSTMPYPVLQDVPVFTMQGGGAALYMPIASGDNCLVVFNDRNMDAWFQTGSAQPPNDGRLHHLADGFALVGVNPLTSGLAAYPNDGSVVLVNGAAKIGLKSGLVTVAGGGTTLLTVLTGLLDVLKALTVQDGSTTLPLTAAAIAALEAYKLVIQGLLY